MLLELLLSPIVFSVRTIELIILLLSESCLFLKIATIYTLHSFQVVAKSLIVTVQGHSRNSLFLTVRNIRLTFHL
jgi:hypothetical protein